MWLGHGTKPDDEEPSPALKDALPSLQDRIHSLGYTLAAGLPASKRHHAVAQLDAADHGRLARVMTGVVHALPLGLRLIPIRVLGKNADAPGIASFVKAGAVIGAAESHADAREATDLVGRSAQEMGLDRFRPFLRQADDHLTQTGGMVALLREVPAPAPSNASPGSPASKLFAGPGAPTDPNSTPNPPSNGGGATGWVYRQSTGELTYNGQHVATGFSGADEGKNNPDMQGVENVGPIPQGRYSIGPQHYSPKVGPGAMNLTPLPGTATYGRTLFRIHGDSRDAPGTGSEGCIVLPPNIRSQLARSPDHTLTVVR